MSVELFHTLSLGSYIIAGVFLLVSTILFFLLNIPKLFGEITGSSARKAIENIRQQNEDSDNKAHKLSPLNASRENDRILSFGKREISVAQVYTENNYTSRLAPISDATALLYERQNQTMLLDTQPAHSDETSILSPQEPTPAHKEETASQGGFSIDFEIGFAESSEIIE